MSSNSSFTDFIVDVSFNAKILLQKNFPKTAEHSTVEIFKYVTTTSGA